MHSSRIVPEYDMCGEKGSSRMMPIMISNWEFQISSQDLIPIAHPAVDCEAPLQRYGCFMVPYKFSLLLLQKYLLCASPSPCLYQAVLFIFADVQTYCQITEWVQ